MALIKGWNAAAQHLGLPRTTLRRAVARGELPASKNVEGWIFTTHNLERFRNEKLQFVRNGADVLGGEDVEYVGDGDNAGVLRADDRQLTLPLPPPPPHASLELRTLFAERFNITPVPVNLDEVNVSQLAFCYLFFVGAVPPILTGRADPTDLVKIGASVHPEVRCRTVLQELHREATQQGAEGPSTGVLLTFLRGGRQTEQFLHRTFAAIRVPLVSRDGVTRQEFFEATPLIDFLSLNDLYAKDCP